MTDVELGWTAGIIDGEGSIEVSGNHQVYVAVSSIDRCITQKLQVLWSGSEWSLGRKTTIGNAIYRWQLTGKKVILLLQTVLPHLVLKGQDAEIAIAFAQTLGKNGRPVPSATREQRDQWILDLREGRRVRHAT